MSNLIFHPNDPSASPWALGFPASGSVDVAYAPGPDGLMTAWQLTDADSGNVYDRGQQATVPSDTLTRYVAVKVAKTSGATHFPAINILYGLDPAAPDKYGAVIVNTNLGTIVNRNLGWAPDGSAISDFGGGFWLVSLYLANNHYTKIWAGFDPAFNANASGDPNVGTTGSTIFVDPMMDLGTAPTAPTAAFTADVVYGAAPLAVQFTDASTGGPSSWAWDFGDGSTSTAQSPAHTYTRPGTYTVTLIATNPIGSSTKIAYGFVIVAGAVFPSAVAVNPAPAGTALRASDADLVENWITSSGSVVIVAGRQGGLVSLSTVGAVLHRLDGVLSSVAFAIASGGYVYCFDGLGHGAVVAVDGTTGAFTPYATFDAPNTEGVLDGFVRGTDLVLACAQRAAVVTFSIATPGAPAAPTRTTNDGYTLNNALNDSGSTPLTDQIQAALGLPVWFPATAGASLAGPTTVIASGPDARVQVK